MVEWRGGVKAPHTRKTEKRPTYVNLRNILIYVKTAIPKSQTEIISRYLTRFGFGNCVLILKQVALKQLGVKEPEVAFFQSPSRGGASLV